jgi:hypothetical protein
MSDEKPKRGMPFDDDDLFAADDLMPEKPKRGAVRVVTVRSSGTNPILILLAVVGAITLLSCGACCAVSVLGVGMFTAEVMPEIEQAVREIEQLSGTLTPFSADLERLAGLRRLGAIERSTPLTDTLTAGQPHAYTFMGDTGQAVSIRASSLDNLFIPALALYGPDGRLIESRALPLSASLEQQTLSLKLPASGQFTLVVSTGLFPGGGRYTLLLR